MDDLKLALVCGIVAWLFLAWLRGEYRLWQLRRHSRLAEWHKKQMGKYL